MTSRQKFRDSAKYMSEIQVDDLVTAFNNRSSTKFLYGKTDVQGRSIAPLNHTAIEDIGESGKAALNFVVDAFSDLALEYERLVNPIDGIPRLRAKRGYVNPIYLYDQQMGYTMDAIYSRHILPQKNNIRTFEHFIEVILDALISYSLQVPITYSSFMKSSLCPIHSSGLVIEVMDESHDLDGDESKISIVESASYPAFAEMAIKHGFTLAMPAPWTLVADINSLKMLEYAHQYIGVDNTSADVLEKFYYRCRGFDLDKLKGAVEDLYETFLFNETEVTKFAVCKDGTLISKMVSIPRKPVNVASNLYGEKKWFYFYVRILVAQERLQIPKTKLDRLFENCYTVLNKHGFERCMDYIERKILGIKTDYYR